MNLFAGLIVATSITGTILAAAPAPPPPPLPPREEVKPVRKMVPPPPAPVDNLPAGATSRAGKGPQAKMGAPGVPSAGSRETPRALPKLPALPPVAVKEKSEDKPTTKHKDPKAYLDRSWRKSEGPPPTPNYVDIATKTGPKKISPEGHYQGVEIFGTNAPPVAPKKLGGKSAKLTWTGFEAAPGRGRVFFQLSALVEPEVWADGATITVKLPRTRAIVHNHMRALDTRHFDTPVQRVRLKRRGKHTQVKIQLEGEMIPEVELTDAANGYKMLVLEFRRPDSKSDSGLAPSLLAPSVTPVAAKPAP